jgi:hypothetical protein
MKNSKILLAILAVALVFGMTACDTGGGGGGSSSNNNNNNSGSGVTIQSTNGQLTISGLSSYNDKYVLALSSNITQDNPPSESKPGFYAAADMSGIYTRNFRLTLGQIKDGTVTMKVWKVTEYTQTSAKFLNYTGSDKNVSFDVEVCEKQDHVQNQPIARGTMTVTFTGGKGSGTASGFTSVKP